MFGNPFKIMAAIGGIILILAVGALCAGVFNTIGAAPIRVALATATLPAAETTTPTPVLPTLVVSPTVEMTPIGGPTGVPTATLLPTVTLAPTPVVPFVRTCWCTSNTMVSRLGLGDYEAMPYAQVISATNVFTALIPSLVIPATEPVSDTLRSVTSFVFFNRVDVVEVWQASFNANGRSRVCTTCGGGYWPLGEYDVDITLASGHHIVGRFKVGILRFCGNLVLIPTTTTPTPTPTITPGGPTQTPTSTPIGGATSTPTVVGSTPTNTPIPTWTSTPPPGVTPTNTPPNPPTATNTLPAPTSTPPPTVPPTATNPPPSSTPVPTSPPTATLIPPSSTPKPVPTVTPTSCGPDCGQQNKTATPNPTTGKTPTPIVPTQTPIPPTIVSTPVKSPTPSR